MAFKVIAVMRVPDHSTIAEFRRRHQDAIAGVFVEVLALSATATHNLLKLHQHRIAPATT